MRRALAGLLWIACGCGSEAAGSGVEATQAAGGAGAAVAAPAGGGGGGAAGQRAGTAGAALGGGGARPAAMPSTSGAAGGAAGGNAAGGGGPAVAVAGAGASGAAGGGAAVGGGAAGGGGAGGGAAGGGAAGASAGAAGAAGAGASGRLPDPKFLVPASGPCPEFRDGTVMFAPDGKQRRVLLYTSGEKGKRGPLLFSWHSTLPNPEDAVSWVGRSVIDEIKAQGGVVAAPSTGYPNETRPWDNTPMGAQNVDGDQRLMDEIVACAIEKLDIDTRRIYATGMSAGGLKSAQVSLRRSGYLAGVVVYSGGFTEGDMPPDQDPTNPVAAMILYGGASDISPVDGINYTSASNRYLEAMQKRGSFAFLCNHGGGHSVPRDSQASAWRFLQDHPFGTKPSPYAMQLPSSFPRYCALPN